MMVINEINENHIIFIYLWTFYKNLHTLTTAKFRSTLILRTCLQFFYFNSSSQQCASLGSTPKLVSNEDNTSFQLKRIRTSSPTDVFYVNDVQAAQTYTFSWHSNLTTHLWGVPQTTILHFKHRINLMRTTLMNVLLCLCTTQWTVRDWWQA